MNLPTMNAESVFHHSAEVFGSEGASHAVPNDGGGVSPQLCVGSPCLRLPSGRFCVNLPILGRRCVTIPSLGSWRVRCCTRFGIPPVSCGIQRC
jgi:hypothetical protein